MQDTRLNIRKRVEATAGLLEYEAPLEVVEQATAFLTTVFEDRNADVDDRLDALGLVRKFEAPKVRQPVVVQTYPPDYTETQRKIAIWDRQSELHRAGLQSSQFPPDWCSDIQSPDWIPPPPDPNEPKTIADLIYQQDQEARRAKLKVIQGDRDSPSQT
jgi:hypothetical protein